ncbi:unnamed protein product [Schistocephalus solidus]|uniref:Calponin-homology (CH) domain-containing protein n=1 Tax=Schistocephalus solidus TaxID=70667 RepID=A0A183SC58_SCHSO|nr:unnamed protein product [Schistocephalus solidus]
MSSLNILASNRWDASARLIDRTRDFIPTNSFQFSLQLAQEESGPKRSGKDALLLWCQNKTKGYANVHVKDFSTSWRDGLAFSALIHSHYPDTIDIAQMKPNEPIKNLQVAFQTAEKCFDVPQLLDPQGQLLVNFHQCLRFPIAIQAPLACA